MYSFFEPPRYSDVSRTAYVQDLYPMQYSYPQVYRQLPPPPPQPPLAPLPPQQRVIYENPSIAYDRPPTYGRAYTTYAPKQTYTGTRYRDVEPYNYKPFLLSPGFEGPRSREEAEDLSKFLRENQAIGHGWVEWKGCREFAGIIAEMVRYELRCEDTRIDLAYLPDFNIVAVHNIFLKLQGDQFADKYGLPARESETAQKLADEKRRTAKKVHFEDDTVDTGAKGGATGKGSRLVDESARQTRAAPGDARDGAQYITFEGFQRGLRFFSIDADPFDISLLFQRYEEPDAREWQDLRMDYTRFYTLFYPLSKKDIFEQKLNTVQMYTEFFNPRTHTLIETLFRLLLSQEDAYDYYRREIKRLEIDLVKVWMRLNPIRRQQVDVEDLRKFLLEFGFTFTRDQLKLFWLRFDKEQTGSISFEQFKSEFESRADIYADKVAARRAAEQEAKDQD